METTSIVLASISSAILIGVSIFLFIRRQYRLFCMREDQKERISVLRKKIESARSYVRKNYSTPLDTSIHDNIIPKMEFIEKLISNKTPDEQEREFQFLLDMLTETFIRLRENFNDVGYVVFPLNSLRDRLVEEHLQWLRDHMDEA